MDSSPKPSPMEAVMSLLKNPSGGAADVNLDDAGKMVAGGIMHGIGAAALLLGTLLMGSALSGTMLINLLVTYIVVSLFFTGGSFIGVNMGAADSKGLGDAVLGGGITGMFFGVLLFLIMLIVKILFSPTMLMIVLMIGIVLGLLMMLGLVAYGLWINRYKVAPMSASMIAVFTVSVGLMLGLWLAGVILGNEMSPRMLGRMF